ncbi:MAG: PEGA domain-containing protein [Acidobacteriota bacterium]
MSPSIPNLHHPPATTVSREDARARQAWLGRLHLAMLAVALLALAAMLIVPAPAGAALAPNEDPAGPWASSDSGVPDDSAAAAIAEDAARDDDDDDHSDDAAADDGRDDDDDDDRRDRRRVRRHHHPDEPGYGGHGRLYVGPRWGWWWGGPRVEVVVGSGKRYYDRRYDGALDLDVRPEKAEVWLDGEYIGVADNYDGFPSFLWLEEGTYDIAFYLEGYKTYHRQVTVRPGVVLDIEPRMERGESVKPRDLQSKSTVNRDNRVRDNRERRETVERRREATRPYTGGDDSGLLPGRVRFAIEPANASIYLNGIFLGIAGELGQLVRGLEIDAGEHVLEVVHPSFDAERVELQIAPDDRQEIVLVLERKR